MKKLLVLSCISIFLFFSCSSTHKMVVDKNTSEARNVIVTFVSDTERGWFSLKEWNDKDIANELYGDKNIGSKDKTVLTVPAGNTSFIVNVYYTFNIQNISATRSFKGVELRYNLERGKEYQVKGIIKPSGLFKGYELFVGIYDVTGSNTLLKEWKLGESQYIEE
jgi:hypothetical protein